MRFFIVSAFLLLSGYCGAATLPVDSIGMEKVDGKVYVLHQVEEKETLYSLARRYSTSIAEITSANPKSENGLSIGQILRIPVTLGHPEDDGRIRHVVQPKETLFSIARHYQVSVDDIKKWNKMSMSLLDIGQELVIYPQGKKPEAGSDLPERNTSEVIRETTHIVQTGETLYSLSRKYGTPLDDLRKWNDLQYNDISIGQTLIVRKQTEVVTPAMTAPPVVVVKDTPETPAPDTASRGVQKEREAAAVYTTVKKEPFERENSNFEEVEEDGLAELIDGSDNNRKYLALHRTAPVGTIMRVRNEMNGQEVFVRIIGRLPDTGTNRNILLKISKAAYEQLGAIDNRFMVRVSYIP